jgi:hypothetical protein
MSYGTVAPRHAIKGELETRVALAAIDNVAASLGFVELRCR